MTGMARGLGTAAALLLFAIGMTVLPRPAAAVCSVFGHPPCNTPYFCSVFDHRPCTPYVCGLHSGATCTPQIFYPLDPDSRHTFRYQTVEAPGGEAVSNPINTLVEFYGAIERCWRPPPLAAARPGMEITVLITFTRSGALLGKPLITYETPGASDDVRLAYRTAMAESIARCTPLPFTDGFGNAQAGRPSRIRFIDNRQQKKAEFNG